MSGLKRNIPSWQPEMVYCVMAILLPPICRKEDFSRDLEDYRKIVSRAGRTPLTIDVEWGRTESVFCSLLIENKLYSEAKQRLDNLISNYADYADFYEVRARWYRVNKENLAAKKDERMVIWLLKEHKHSL